MSGYSTHQMILAFRDLRSELHPDFVIATFVAGNDVYDNAMFEGQLAQQSKTPLGFVGRHSHAARLVLKSIWPATFFLANRNMGNIAHTIGLLRRLDADFAQAGLPYLMVVIPARHQIRPGVRPKAELLVRLGLRNLVYRQNRMVIDHFVRDGIPHVDTYPALAARDAHQSVISSDDPHTNALGYEIIATTIYEAINLRVAELLAARSMHLTP